MQIKMEDIIEERLIMIRALCYMNNLREKKYILKEDYIRERVINIQSQILNLSQIGADLQQIANEIDHFGTNCKYFQHIKEHFDMYYEIITGKLDLNYVGYNPRSVNEVFYTHNMAIRDTVNFYSDSRQCEFFEIDSSTRYSVLDLIYNYDKLFKEFKEKYIVFTIWLKAILERVDKLGR